MSFDRNKASNHTPAKTYRLRNKSNRDNFFQCSESSNSGNSSSFMCSGRGTTGASSQSTKSGMTEEALTQAGVVKLPNGAYQLNGMELSGEELDFVLENTMPQEGSESTSSALESGTSRNGGEKIPQKRALSSSAASKGSSNMHPRQLKFRKNPLTSAEKVLAQFTKEVSDSPGSGTTSGHDDKAQCSICLSFYHEESSFQTEKETARDLVGCVSLSLCGHIYHTCCLLGVISLDSSSISCPYCKRIHGVLTGTQPVGGSMDVSRMRESLPGHPKTKTIVISYNFPRGVQGPEHPNPGQPYHLVAFPRVGFLPDTPKGNKVLSLLREAFKRRLVFTVGTSATTGQSDCVVWNGIHHKTETTNYGGHGYPDPNYLDNVTMELALLGVTDGP